MVMMQDLKKLLGQSFDSPFGFLMLFQFIASRSFGICIFLVVWSCEIFAMNWMVSVDDHSEKHWRSDVTKQGHIGRNVLNDANTNAEENLVFHIS